MFFVFGASATGGIILSLLWRWLKPKAEVAGRTVFITGGSEGIGKAIGLEFVKRGANVVLMARTESKLKAAVEELRAARTSDKQKVELQTMDVTSYTNVQEGIAKAAEKLGSPEFLITSAGAAHPGYFLEQEPEVFDKTMRLNYMGNVNVIKAVAPMMKSKGGGHIMIISSAAGVCSFIGYASYAPSKWALRGFADALRNELSGFGIRVAICYPPDTDTPGFKEENKTKPPETLACFPADAYLPEKVAAQSVNSLLMGDYHIQSVDVFQNLLVSSMAGVTPRSFTILETLLLPVISFVQQAFRMWFDFQARKYAAREKLKAGVSSRKED